MPVPKARKIGIVILVLFLLVLLAIATLPFWLPWMAGPALQRFGVSVANYDRVGYNRLVLGEVEYSDERIDFQAERVEILFPLGWLWHRWRETEAVDFVAADNWRVEIHQVEDEAPDRSVEREEETSVFQVFEGIEDVLPKVIDWLPRARLGRGDLQMAERRIEVRGATWDAGLVTAEVFDPALEQLVVFEGDVSDGLPFRLRGRTDPFPLVVDVVVARVEEGLEFRSEAGFAGNRLVADARFPREGIWPERASFRSDEFRVPGEYLELEGYQDVVGALRFEWVEGRFRAELQGEAEPAPGRDVPLPPLRVNASARGDLTGFVVETLEVHSPWLVATLSDPVAMDYSGELLSGTSVFQVAADLVEQPFVELEGLVQGEVRISPGEERLPWIDFSLTVENLAGFDVSLERVGLEGSLRWPELVVSDLRMDAADGSRVTSEAVVNFEAREVSHGSIEGLLDGRFLANWLPEDVSVGSVRLDGSFAGPFDDLRHNGIVIVEEFLHPQTHPINGDIRWQGRMANLEEFAVELVAGRGRLQLAGASELLPEQLSLVVDSLRLEREEETLLEAVGASRLQVSWGDEPIAVLLEGLHWTGEAEVEAAADVSWPVRGNFSGKMRSISTELLIDFIDIDAGFLYVPEIEIQGGWEEGPVEFQAVASLQLDLEAADEILVEIAVRGEEERLVLDRLRGTSRGDTLALAEGVLPIAFWPERSEVIRIGGNDPVDFRIRTDPEARFWEQIGDFTGVYLEDPELSLEIKGTPYEPTGYMRGQSSRIRVQTEGMMPVVEQLRLEAVFDTDRIEVEELSLMVEGQRAELEARLPMGSDEWRKMIRENELPKWEQATGRLRIPSARLASFARFAPGVLAPQGTLEADVEILPGGFFDGAIVVTDVATRPLMPLGTVREGSARVALRERTAYLEEISAVIGGERVSLAGRVDLPIQQPLAFDLSLQGRNVPLTRQPGIVVRGDLDLAARSREEEPPLISGRVDLRNSYYMAHLRLMPAGGVATPERRPPFFSITQEPFSNWRLNVDLRGPGFLNVRGPIFQGEISANFNLAGTLEEPMAIGSATIDSGRIRFPFATMAIDHGEVSLRREDPFQPQLFVVASGMTFGYDLTMEITGTAETPVIEFVSNPPVTSEQALLMVTTGELPREEIRFTTQQRATRFAVYFGRNLLYELTEDDSAADRLIIRTGEQVSEGGRETTAIEFKMTERWSLTGEYDRFDEYNVGVKWNIFSR